MWIVKVENGQPVRDANGQPVLVEVPDPPSAADIERAAQQAAAASATATRAQMEEAQRAREAELQEQMRQREEQARINALPEAEQMRERMRVLEEGERRRANELAEMRRQHGQEIRQLGLVAYTERAAREVHPSVVHLVGGASETEIDASVDAAQQAYTTMRTSIEAELRAEFERGQQSAQPGTNSHGQPAPAPTYVHVQPPAPRTPYVTAPPDPQGGYPTPTNVPTPQAPVEEQPTEVFTGMSTEDAVRSGRYSGEMRAKALNSVRGIQYRGQLGAAPRYALQQHQQQHAPNQHTVPHVVAPDGTMHPQGLPTPQAQNPHQYQQPPQYAPPTYQQQPQAYPPQYAPPPQPQYAPPPQQYAAPPQQQPAYQQPYPQQPPQYAPPPAPPPQSRAAIVQQAREAADRVRSGGGHPEVAAGVRNAVAHTQKHLSSPAGVPHTSPQQVFDGRFAPTPPAGAN